MRSRILALATAVLLALPLPAASGPWGTSEAEGDDISELDLAQIMQIKVTSVSRREEKLGRAAAAVTVLTSEDIRRSGASSLAEVLRLVPGVQVARFGTAGWAVSARGFNAAFANKLLVLVDGRSVYTPRYAGVNWSMQEVPLEDVDRIEVIRGPGSALWGSNAVNGVINVITRRADQTPGGLLALGTGTLDRFVGTVRYGGALTEDVHGRVYGRGFHRQGFDLEDGTDSGERWSQARTGFRLDGRASDASRWMLQGDYQEGRETEVAAEIVGEGDTLDTVLIRPEKVAREGHVLARWTRTFSDRSEIVVQAYVDHLEREGITSAELRDTVDLDLQHDWTWYDDQRLVWGLGYRLMLDRQKDVVATQTRFDPPERDQQLVTGFVQNETELLDRSVRLILGTKVEHNDYTGFEVQPTARLSWTPDDTSTIWAAVTRAVRIPSRVDRDSSIEQPVLFDLVIGPFELPLFPVFQANPAFEAEDLLAVELGVRYVPTSVLSFDVAAFAHRYDDQLSFELLASGAEAVEGFFEAILGLAEPPYPIPFTLGNELDVETAGVELAVRWDVTEAWRLTGSYSYLHIDVERDPGSFDVFATELLLAGGPEHQGFLRSTLDLPWQLEVDATLYVTGEIEARTLARRPAIPAHARGDLRVGWRPRDDLELSVLGQDLFESDHPEGATTFLGRPIVEVPRRVSGRVTWSF